MSKKKDKLRECPHCGSENVCWGWWHIPEEEYKRMNPHLTDITGDNYGHECWDCDNCFDTYHEVTDGISYEDLKKKHNIED